MKIHDQHVHSYYSFDSKQSIEGYLNNAVAHGLSYFVLTDHLDLDYLDSGKDLDFDPKKEKEELNSLQKKFPTIKLLQGVEIGFKPSRQKRIEEIIGENNFDVINLSMHEAEGIDFYYPEPFVKSGISYVLDIYFKELLRSLNEFPTYDVASHIDYAFKTAYLIDNSLKLSDFENKVIEILKVIISKDKVLEINTKVQSFLPIEHTRYLLKLYKSLGGVNISLSSDAHDVSRLCDGFDTYIKVIKEEGFDHLNYFVKRERFDLKI